MKRTFLSMVMLVAACVCSFAAEQLTTIWEGENKLGNWANAFTIEASKFANVEDWNFIRVTISEIDPAGKNQYPQVGIRINAEGWPALDGTAFTPSNEPGTYDFRINQYGAADLKQYGAVVQGSWGTVTKVEILSGYEPAYPDAIWSGHVDMGSSWGVWATIDHSCFKRANVGDIVRLYVSELRAGAQCLFQFANASYGWEKFEGIDFQPLSGKYIQYEITDKMLPILRGENNEKGIIVSGVNFTLEAMAILGPQYSEDGLNVKVDHNKLVFVDQKPQLSLNYSFNNALADLPEHSYVIEVKNDKMQPVGVTKGTTKSANVVADLNIGDNKCGVFNYTLSIENVFAESYNFVVNPEDIKAADDSQPDFEAFWDKARADLAAVDPQYKLTEVPQYSGAARKVYLVEMYSVADGTGEPVVVRGHYAMPVKPGTYPCIVTFQGYDSAGGDIWPPSGAYNGDWCEFVLSTRGQVINNRPPYENTYGDWFAYGFDSKDHYYYRGAFMDAVRAIEFVASRPEVQAWNIFAQGQSQGGALTIAAAALSQDTRLKAIAPAIQFLGDFPNYFQVASWPASVAFACQKQYGMTDAEMYAMLSYFDTKNLAKWVDMPVSSSVSLQDNVCPLRTNLAPYNNFASTEKQYSINNTLGHQVPNEWYNQYMDFFRSHITDEPAGIDAIGTQPVAGAVRYYNVLGQPIAAPTAGQLVIAVDANGKATKTIVK